MTQPSAHLSLVCLLQVAILGGLETEGVGETPDVDECISCLNSPHGGVRENARRQLAQVPQEAVPKLIAHLKPDDPVFSAAVEVLGNIGTPETIQALREVYDGLRTRQALEAFLQGLAKATHPRVIPIQVEVLKQEDGAARAYAWSGLAQHAAKELLPYRGQLLPHVDAGLQDVKQAPNVLRVVGRVGHDSGIDFFLPFVLAKDPEILKAVKESLWDTDEKVKAGFRAILYDAKQSLPARLQAYAALSMMSNLKFEDLMAGQGVADQMTMEKLEKTRNTEDPEAMETELIGLIVVPPDFWLRVCRDEGWAERHRLIAFRRLATRAREDGTLSEEILKCLAQHVRNAQASAEIRTESLKSILPLGGELRQTLVFEAARSDEPRLQEIASYELPKLAPSKDLLHAYVAILKTSKVCLLRRRALIGLVDLKDPEATRVVLDWLETEEGQKEFWLAPYLREEIRKQEEEPE